MATRTSTPLGLDHLVLLHEEMAAIARAKMPLADTLRAFGSDTPGKLGQAAREVADRLSQGQSLEQAVENVSSRWPQAYTAVVRIGIRVGRLPAALEAVADVSRSILAARRAVVTAMLYPVTVLFIAYCLALFAIAWTLPSLVSFAIELRVPYAIEFWQQLWNAIATMRYWGPIPPLLLAIYLSYCWWRLGRITLRAPSQRRYSLHPLAQLADVQAFQSQAAFCDVLALLIEHAVPLPEAIRLAQQAVGDSLRNSAIENWATALEQGSRSPAVPSVLPRALEAVMREPDPQAAVYMLRSTATQLRDHAAAKLHWMRTRFPIIASLALGGTSVALYAAGTLVPWLLLMQRLSRMVEL